MNQHTPKQLLQSIVREFRFNQAAQASGSGSDLSTPPASTPSSTDYCADIPDDLLKDLADQIEQAPTPGGQSVHQTASTAVQPTPVPQGGQPVHTDLVQHTPDVQPTPQPNHLVQPTPPTQRGQSVHPTSLAQSVHTDTPQIQPTPQDQPLPQGQQTPPASQPIPQIQPGPQIQNTTPNPTGPQQATSQVRQTFVQPGPSYQARGPQTRPYRPYRPSAPFGPQRTNLGPPAPLPRRVTNFSSLASFDAARQNRQARQEPFPSRHLFTSNQRPTPILVQAHVAESTPSATDLV